jgi:hypothetical protein
MVQTQISMGVCVEVEEGGEREFHGVKKKEAW